MKKKYYVQTTSIVEGQPYSHGQTIEATPTAEIESLVKQGALRLIGAEKKAVTGGGTNKAEVAVSENKEE
jgi:hypothetical protein